MGGGSPLIEDPHPSGGYTTHYGLAYNPVMLFATSSYSVPFGEGSLTFALKGWKLSGGSSIPTGTETVPVLTPTVLMDLVKSAEPVYEFVVPGAHSGSGTPETVTDIPGSANGGYLMVNRVIGTVEHKYWVPEGGVVPARIVSYYAWPWPGFTWCETQMNGEAGGRSSAGATLVESTTGTADFTQLATLTVEIASEDPDPTGAKPECMGYYTLSPAKYYFAPDRPAVGTTPASLGEEVTITATPRAGYKFVKWVGTGLATYKLLGFIDIPARLDLENNPITCDTITITMHSDRELKAVFELQGGTFTLYVDQPVDNTCITYNMGTPERSDGNETLGRVGHTFWRFDYYGSCEPDKLKELSKCSVPESYISELPIRILGASVDDCPEGEPNCAVNILGTHMGFYPADDDVGCLHRTSPPQIWLDDRSHLSEVQRDGVIKIYEITFEQLLSGLQAVHALIANDTAYSLLSRNCTTVAIDIGRACNIDIPSATYPGVLGQLLKGETCPTPDWSCDMP
jgi:hypothetical protein